MEFGDLTGEETIAAFAKYDFSSETGEYVSVSSKANARLTASICLPLLTNTSITPAQSNNINNTTLLNKHKLTNEKRYKLIALPITLLIAYLITD